MMPPSEQKELTRPEFDRIVELADGAASQPGNPMLMLGLVSAIGPYFGDILKLLLIGLDAREHPCDCGPSDAQ